VPGGGGRFDATRRGAISGGRDTRCGSGTTTDLVIHDLPQEVADALAAEAARDNRSVEDVARVSLIDRYRPAPSERIRRAQEKVRAMFEGCEDKPTVDEFLRNRKAMWGES